MGLSPTLLLNVITKLSEFYNRNYTREPDTTGALIRGNSSYKFANGRVIDST